MIRPMLAVSIIDEEEVPYPVLVSPKLDGIRCLMKDGRPMSRSGEVHPNKFLQAWAQQYGEHLHGLDGELIVGNPTDPNVYNATESGIMSEDGEPDFTYYVFDNWLYTMQFFTDRYRTATAMARNVPRCHMINQFPCQNSRELLQMFEGFRKTGYEGLVAKHPEGFYKNGRSTAKQGFFMRLKPWEDSEAEIVEVKEQMKNNNPPKYSEVGYMRRSTAKANKVPAGTLGGLIVKDIHSGVEFKIGGGKLKRSQKDALWAMKDQLPGKIIKYKFFGYGVKDKPRQPVLIGFRTEIDL